MLVEVKKQTAAKGGSERGLQCLRHCEKPTHFFPSIQLLIGSLIARPLCKHPGGLTVLACFKASQNTLP